MPSTISINTLVDNSDGVDTFYRANNLFDSSMTNNLMRASTIKRVLADTRVGSIFPDGSIPSSKVFGLNISTPSQSISGAIGSSLSPSVPGQIAWYTITPLNLAYNTLFWNNNGRVGINTSNPGATLHVQSGTNLNDSIVDVTITGSNGAIDIHNSLTAGSWSPVVREGDKGIIFRANGQTAPWFYTTSPTISGGFVISPWSGAGVGGIRIDISGNVGVGSSSPRNKLTVEGGITTTTGVTASIGTSVVPSYSFEGYNRSGFYYDDSDNRLSISFNGTRVVSMNADTFLSSEEFVSTNPNSYRIVQGRYGVFDRNDGTDYYKLLTNLDEQYGSFNALRPFSINLASGRVGIGGAADNTAFAAALKVTGKLNVTSDSSFDNALSVGTLSVTNNITTQNTLLARRTGETGITATINSPTVTIDLSTGSVFSWVLNQNITSLSILNPLASGRVNCFILQINCNGTSKTIAWPSSVRWSSGAQPFLTSTAGKIDTLGFLSTDGGSNWFAFILGQNA